MCDYFLWLWLIEFKKFSETDIQTELSNSYDSNESTQWIFCDQT